MQLGLEGLDLDDLASTDPDGSLLRLPHLGVDNQEKLGLVLHLLVDGLATNVGRASDLLQLSLGLNDVPARSTTGTVGVTFGKTGGVAPLHVWNEEGVRRQDDRVAPVREELELPGSGNQPGDVRPVPTKRKLLGNAVSNVHSFVGECVSVGDSCNVGDEINRKVCRVVRVATESVRQRPAGARLTGSDLVAIGVWSLRTTRTTIWERESAVLDLATGKLVDLDDQRTGSTSRVRTRCERGAILAVCVGRRRRDRVRIVRCPAGINLLDGWCGGCVRRRCGEREPAEHHRESSHKRSHEAETP